MTITKIEKDLVVIDTLRGEEVACVGVGEILQKKSRLSGC